MVLYISLNAIAMSCDKLLIWQLSGKAIDLQSWLDVCKYWYIAQLIIFHLKWLLWYLNFCIFLQLNVKHSSRKDTIIALEKGPSRYHLSHYTPHRPDIHWNTENASIKLMWAASKFSSSINNKTFKKSNNTKPVFCDL